MLKINTMVSGIATRVRTGRADSTLKRSSTLGRRKKLSSLAEQFPVRPHGLYVIENCLNCGCDWNG